MPVEGGQIAVHQRINITLPEETLQLIDRVAEKGDRSRFINEAVQHYIDQVGRANLKKRMRAEAIHEREGDLALAGEWFHLDEEAWERSER